MYLGACFLFSCAFCLSFDTKFGNSFPLLFSLTPIFFGLPGLSAGWNTARQSITVSICRCATELLRHHSRCAPHSVSLLSLYCASASNKNRACVSSLLSLSTSSRVTLRLTFRSRSRGFWIYKAQWAGLTKSLPVTIDIPLSEVKLVKELEESHQERLE